MFHFGELVLFIAAILLGQVAAVDQYYKCLECFARTHQEEDDFYFCNPIAACMNAKSWDCAPADQVVSPAGCVESIN